MRIQILTALMFFFSTLTYANGENQNANLSLSDVMQCLAIVNGASAIDAKESTTVLEKNQACPEGIAPIWFSKSTGLEKHIQGRAITALSRLLSVPAAKDLQFQFVGHSEDDGSKEDRNRISWQRATTLRDLMPHDVRKRILVVGRSDSEPFGQDYDNFDLKGHNSGGDNNIKCLYGNYQVNCDRRVSVEVISPLLVRYGSLPAEREASGVIDSSSDCTKEKPCHVARLFPKGVTPGQPLAINLMSLDIPGLEPTWDDTCQHKKTDWQKLDKTGSPFDAKAGNLFARLRFREAVPSRSVKIPDLEPVLEIAAGSGDKKPDSLLSLQPAYPDYWALYMRLHPHREELKKLVEKLQGALEGTANKCLSKLADPSQIKEDDVWYTIWHGVLDQIPLHGDDRLAQAYGVNYWTTSFSLYPDMELCIEEPLKRLQEGTNVYAVYQPGRQNCVPITARNTSSGQRLNLATGIGNLGILFNITPTNEQKGLCNTLRSENGFFEATTVEELACFGDRGAMKVFLLLGDSIYKKNSHFLLAALNQKKMDEFIAKNGDELCNNNHGDAISAEAAPCIGLSWEILSPSPNKKDEKSRTRPPSLYARINLPGANPGHPVILGTRLSAFEKERRENQLKGQNRTNISIEFSDEMLDQWPIIGRKP